MRNAKLAKVPIDHRTLQPGSVTDPAIYMNAQDAFYMAALYGDAYGVGFCFTENDPCFFIDIDAGYRGGEWSTLTCEIVAQFPGAAQEISQSGTGLHIFGTYKALMAHSNKNVAENIELYTTGRFVALTFNQLSGDVASDHTVALTNLTAKYFPPTSIIMPQEWTDKPVKHWDGIEDDVELIKQACKSKSARAAFGHGATFKDLWEANADALGKAYPDAHSGREYDASSADGALAFHLAFWTGNDCERILRLMLDSALHRQKWDDRLEDYLKARTILGACSGQTKAYNRGHNRIKELPEQAQAVEAKLRVGYQWLTPNMQMEFFKGCCYVSDSPHKIFVPSGELLKPDQFNVLYGGYTFAMDDTGKAKTTKAFEAFTQSQAANFPKANSSLFVPTELPGKILDIDGRTYVNTYVPIPTRQIEGDITPFLTYFKKLLPNEHDRNILLAYMAAIVQYPGVKFQWAPVIQGTEGNGKTLLTRCVVYAVGMPHCHLPTASELSEKFNSWLFDKIVIGIEEMHVPEGRLSVLSILNAMITNTDLAMRGMQQEQKMKRNVANFMLNSNRKDAVPKDKSGRRFSVFFTAQQSVDDLERDGMGGDYFPKLYDWLKADGYAIVTRYLYTYAIPNELNPAKDCQRAPITSTTHEAITASLGTVEQEIMDAVKENHIGFSGGFISSHHLRRTLDSLHLRRAISVVRRREMLNNLGYDWHPALREGRVNNPIMIDDGKASVLFVHRDHINRSIETSARVVQAYIEAQGKAAIIPPNVISAPGRT